MPEDGPLDLGDKIVWFKNGAVHRAAGPAIEFKDGRKLWAINGKEVTEQEAAAYREENDRQARALADKMWQSHIEQAAEIFTRASNVPSPCRVRVNARRSPPTRRNSLAPRAQRRASSFQKLAYHQRPRALLVHFRRSPVPFPIVLRCFRTISFFRS